MPSQWVLAAVVVAVLVLVLVSIGAAVGRAAERRSRRGLLELDTPGARRALGRREILTSPIECVGVCGHPIALGAEFVAVDAWMFCSPRCADERRMTALYSKPDEAA